jgi:hypothetical protein
MILLYLYLPLHVFFFVDVTLVLNEYQSLEDQLLHTGLDQSQPIKICNKRNSI